MKIIHQFIIFCLTCLTTLLIGCDRNDYVTWECKGVQPSIARFKFLLDGSTMKLENRDLKFCGSLGNSSFFDESCPSQIEKSKVLFIPKKGDFIEDMQAYRCSAL